MRELEERVARLEATQQQYASRPPSLAANSTLPSAAFDAFPAVPARMPVVDVVEAPEDSSRDPTPTPPERDDADEALQAGDDDTADLSAAVSAVGPIIDDSAESSPELVVRPPSGVLPPMPVRAARSRRQGSVPTIGSVVTSPTQPRRLTGTLKARFEAFRQGSLPGGATSPASELPYISISPSRPTMHIRASSEPRACGASSSSLTVPLADPAATSTLLHEMDDPFAAGPGRVRKPRVSGGLSSIPLDALGSAHIDQMLMRDPPI